MSVPRQQVDFRFLTAEAEVRSRTSRWGIVCGERGNVACSLRLRLFSPVTIFPPILHIYLNFNNTPSRTICG